MSRSPLVLAVALVSLSALASPALAQRALGVDVYSGQNVSSWSTVQSAGISFVFMKATEGATFNDSVYDFRDNAIRKTSTLLFAPYHFARPDSNTAVVEANHFFDVAGKSMRAGNLLPVLDLEDGGIAVPTATSRATLTAWATAFSDRIYALAGVRPIVYVSGDYARNQLTTAANTLDLWYANPGYSVSSALANLDATSNYGVWNGVPNAKSGSSTAAEWSFWQYNWKGQVAGIDGFAAGTGIKANTASDLDLDVANGDVDYVKRFKIPAIYQSDADGAFGDTAKWNTNYYDRDAGVTVYGLPTSTDRVRIDRASANPLVTVSTNARVAQSLDLGDRLAVTSGSLTIAEYANLNGATTVSGGALSAASIANASTLLLSGGTATSTGALTGTGTTSVTGGSLFAASITQASLAVAGTGRAKLTGIATNGKVNALSVAPTATFDTGVARIVDDYAGASPLDAIRALALVGAVTSTNKTSELGVGFIEATRLYPTVVVGTQWFGQTIDGTSLLMQLALFGDTDLNGTVNSADLTALAAGFGKPGAWQAGDFNYDGVVNAVDLGLLGANYLKSYALGGNVTGGDPLAFQNALAGFPSLVPEPTTLALLGMLGAIGRRRRVV